MSDDIAAELLATAKLYDDAGVDGSAGADMCRAAAAELARLRAEVARLREAGKGASDIAAERARQVASEGWSHHHDDGHRSGEIAGAAACYILAGLQIGRPDLRDRVRLVARDLWPWDREWWKPRDRRSDLVRAGALVAAEIDRLDRAALEGGET